MTTKDRELAETYLRGLEKLGFDVKSAWMQLTTRVDDYERGTPGDLDRRYSCPTTAPSIGAHFIEGLKPQVLAPHVMWAGYHYALTPGQRRWFREFTGMTPAQTVTISWIELWPGTQHPRAFKVVSDLHVDPRNRKHVISEFVVREPGAFFATAAAFDAEEPVVKTLSIQVGPCKVFSATHRWAVEDLSGVKLKGDVGISMITDDVVQFSDVTGRVANVKKEEFLATVTDYDRLHNPPKKKGSRKTGVEAALEDAGTLEDLVNDLDSIE